MKQVVEFKRIERVKLELDVLELLSGDALEQYMNTTRPIGSPEPITISRETADWGVIAGALRSAVPAISKPKSKRVR